MLRLSRNRSLLHGSRFSPTFTSTKVQNLVGRIAPNSFLRLPPPRVFSTQTLPQVPQNENQKERLPSKPFITEKGIFGLFPMYSIVGLSVAYLISKEILMIDEELLVGTVVSTWLFGFYLAFSDTIKQTVDSELKQQDDWLADVHDLQIDALKRYMLVMQQKRYLSDDLTDLYEAEKKSRQLSVEYQNLKFGSELTASVLQKLQTIKNLEDEEASSYKRAIAETAMKSIHDSIQTPEMKEKLFKVALESIPVKGAVVSGDDPIGNLVKDILSNPPTKQQIGRESRTQQYIDRDIRKKQT